MNNSAKNKDTSKPGNADELLELLEQIQLESFWQILRDQLQITRLSHFEFVEAKDLEKVGMSKPAIRRLLDAVGKKIMTIAVPCSNSPEKPHMAQSKPVRPAPPPPLPSQLPSSFSPSSILKISATYNNNSIMTSTVPFNPDNRTESKLYTNSITKNALTSKLLNLNKSKKPLARYDFLKNSRALCYCCIMSLYIDSFLFNTRLKLHGVL